MRRVHGWSLAVSATVESDPLAEQIGRWFARWDLASIRLSSIGIFPTEEGVVFCGLTVDSDLLGLHREFFRVFEPPAPSRAHVPPDLGLPVPPHLGIHIPLYSVTTIRARPCPPSPMERTK